MPELTPHIVSNNLAYTFCRSMLQANISCSVESINKFMKRKDTAMEMDQLSEKEKAIQWISIVYDGFAFGNWPKELVG